MLNQSTEGMLFNIIYQSGCRIILASPSSALAKQNKHLKTNQIGNYLITYCTTEACGDRITAQMP